MWNTLFKGQKYAFSIFFYLLIHAFHAYKFYEDVSETSR